MATLPRGECDSWAHKPALSHLNFVHIPRATWSIACTKATLPRGECDSWAHQPALSHLNVVHMPRATWSDVCTKVATSI